MSGVSGGPTEIKTRQNPTACESTEADVDLEAIRD